MFYKKYKIVLATQNKNKIKEIKKILGSRFEIIELKKFPKIIENRKTLEENATKKAKAIYRYIKTTGNRFRWGGILASNQHACSLQNVVLADDSGLEVEVLKGKPGVYSARFAGKNCTYSDNNKKLLKLLKNVPYKKRKARFKTVVAIVFRDGKIKTTEGTVSGYITTEPKGSNGFGYDPVFYYPTLKKTYAQLTLEQKNKISHRAIAFKKAKNLIFSVSAGLLPHNYVAA